MPVGSQNTSLICWAVKGMASKAEPVVVSGLDGHLIVCDSVSAQGLNSGARTSKLTMRGRVGVTFQGRRRGFEPHSRGILQFAFSASAAAYDRRCLHMCLRS